MTALLAPATIPLGTEVSTFAQLAALVALLVAMLLGESQRSPVPDRTGS